LLFINDVKKLKYSVVIGKTPEVDIAMVASAVVHASKLSLGGWQATSVLKCCARTLKV